MPLSVAVDPQAVARGAVDKIAAARVWLLKDKPFFGVLARALRVEPQSDLPSALRLLPDDRLLVHPKAILALPFRSLGARLSHVAMHAALTALARRARRSAPRWNVAHDLAVEPLLRAADMEASSGELPAWLRQGLSAEEIYELLPEDAAPAVEWCDLCDAPRPPQEDASPPPGAPRGSAGDSDEGDGAKGDADDGADNGPSEDGPGVDEPALAEEPTEAPHEARAREMSWKMRLAEAMQAERDSGGKTWGSTPAWIDAMVGAVIAPPPSWTAILQRSVATLARSERSFLRPSRRQSAIAFDEGTLWPPIVSMPGRKVVLAGQLVAIVDTSASMGEDLLAQALGAICAAATAEGIDTVRLMQADAAVTADEIITPADLLTRKIAVVGRGGTAFGPALLKLAGEALRNAERFTVVYVTDLDGSFPAKDAMRGLDLLWVTPVKRPVPFGRVLRLA